MASARSHVLRLLALLAIGLLPAGGHAATVTAIQESGAAEPIVVLDEAGVELSVVGSVLVRLDAAGETYLTLERITIGEGETFGPLAPTSPELIVMDAGALQQQDERGFWARMEAPYQMALSPGDQVAWSAASETNLLRVQLTDAMPNDIAFEGVTVERVAQFRLDEVPAGPIQIFVGQASVSARSGGARLEQDGSLGIVVESGSLDLVSPSGLEGTLGEGQSALYSDGAPIEILGTSDNDSAEALLVGVSPSERPIEASVAITCQNGESTCIELV